jgi:BMFP domain-containing protein YqiC
MFHWLNSRAQLAQLERRIAVLESRIAESPRDREPPSGGLEPALASLGRAIAKAAAAKEREGLIGTAD